MRAPTGRNTLSRRRGRQPDYPTISSLRKASLEDTFFGDFAASSSSPRATGYFYTYHARRVIRFGRRPLSAGEMMVGQDPPP